MEVKFIFPGLEAQHQEAKVSKDEMSEVLFEFGMRIKGLEIVTDLPRLPVSGHVDDSR